MMFDAHMTDGRTVFRFRRRGAFVELLKRDLGNLENDSPINAWARWSPEDEFVPVRLNTIRKNSVAFTNVVDGEERQKFEEYFPPPPRQVESTSGSMIADALEQS